MNGTAQDVYEHDIHNCVTSADLLIAECSYPSIGLGWEMATAVEKYQKHVLAVARKDSRVSRFVLGVQCERNPKFSFELYESPAELLRLAYLKVTEVQASMFSKAS